MAQRPAWFVKDDEVRKRNFDFTWHPGQARVQRVKNVKALHESIGSPALEVSTKGDPEIGQHFSPFNLTLNGIPVENLYQSTKTYENGGPYLDMLEAKSNKVKGDQRHDNSGELICYTFDGKEYPKQPRTAFYNYLYYLAALDSLDKELLDKLNDFEYFTDIEFNPKKSTVNQARAVALLKAIYNKFGELPELSWEEFVDLENSILKEMFLNS